MWGILVEIKKCFLGPISFGYFKLFISTTLILWTKSLILLNKIASYFCLSIRIPFPTDWLLFLGESFNRSVQVFLGFFTTLCYLRSSEWMRGLFCVLMIRFTAISSFLNALWNYLRFSKCIRVKIIKWINI